MFFELFLLENPVWAHISRQCEFNESFPTKSNNNNNGLEILYHCNRFTKSTSLFNKVDEFV
jgi:hypothetical protein